MADDADRAKPLQDNFNDELLRDRTRRRQEIGPGTSECESCGEEIPEARRKAQPSCTHCIECQTKLEMKFRRHA
ncbi:MAG: TraR/DksA family transcriptional regulator [Desulfuromonadaceae bacterium]|nr:TraR/DksA family transcriptional regulator [Desulfuromonadaceae bacterium]MDD5107574.1 TraR/DksA family transcriptional regulator [Desulfuromonadaceae bacterium]